jgi:hypothetical protein
MLNKLILRAVLSVSLALGSIGANATLISQDILDNGAVIGNVTINLDDAQVWDTDLSVVSSFTEFNIFGYDLTTYSMSNTYFDATFFHDDLSAGIFTLNFDLTEEFDFFAWTGDIFSDFNDNVLTISDDQGVFIFSDQISMGDVSVVPTPATLVLFLTAVAGLASRRKNS